ncbi:MAG: DUF3841 domain-containing protein [Mogibacterium sp.]|nr:DUF3841 domain-containing protein [Mogibacterium sp.]
MGTASDHIILYSPQAEIVWDAVMEHGEAFSRREYVSAKYEECAGIFLTAYDAYVREAEKIVPRPDDKAYPYWAFSSMEQVDLSGGGRVMKLEVPVREAVFFDQYDWYKVLRLSYIGLSPEDEAAFARKLNMRGIRDASEAVLKPFYPDVKREIIGSWKRLFRHDDAIRQGDLSGVRAVQAGLWQIKKEWLI